ncbi:MAG: PTS galactitol transporter subunit IIB [Acidimicrobiia bacterium]|nr:PTS galactitol transporter subunit IIB [Acidimicrobiia bacterium]
MKKVLIVCGTGIATSTVVADKVRKHLAKVGIEAKIDQTKVTELHRGAKGYDLIVATTQTPSSIDVPVVKGLSFLTGMGVDETLAEIEEQLSD